MSQAGVQRKRRSLQGLPSSCGTERGPASCKTAGLNQICTIHIFLSLVIIIYVTCLGSTQVEVTLQESTREVDSSLCKPQPLPTTVIIELRDGRHQKVRFAYHLGSFHFYTECLS